jgi:hypothetical protein
LRPFRVASFLIASVAYAASASVMPVSAAVTPIGVKTTSLHEFLPSAGMDSGSGDTYFAWSQNRQARPGHHDAYLDITIGSTTSTIKLNAKGTLGWGAGIDGTQLVFQEVPNDTRNSGLVLYDISTATRLPTPPGLNSTAWQWGPTMSGDWILYGENSRRQDFSRVMLHNTTTDEERIVAESSFAKFSVFQGQVNGDYATYHRDRKGHSDVFVYQISTGDRTKVPNPNDRYNYRGAVTADGTVYYARSALGCGNNVRIYRWSVTAPADPVLINALPDGKEIAGRVFVFNDGSSTTVYFDRLSCRSGNSDIYRLDDADTA